MKVHQILILLAQIWISREEQCGSCNPFLSWYADLVNEHHSLCGYVLERLNVSGAVECFLKCVDNCRCVSFNVALEAAESGDYRCELSYMTKEATPTSDFKSRPGFMYASLHVVQNTNTKCKHTSCDHNCCEPILCQNSGVCTGKCALAKRLACDCATGLTGGFCEKKGIKVLSGVVTQHFLSHDMTWSSGDQFCKQLDQKLCSIAQICPSPRQPVTGLLSGDNWTPVADKYNEWIQIGDIDYHYPCKLHHATFGTTPWGDTAGIYEKHKGTVLCCRDPSKDSC